MTAYVVAQLTITGRAACRSYQGAFPAILARLGGRLLAAGDQARATAAPARTTRWCSSSSRTARS
ncbi:MAG TPA: DUF1330 domain-containing protein [Streptosporangiaceae bacterium]|nr:DUF1330 domain-containing protein [Streptosporangiaceae bacterium]